MPVLTIVAGPNGSGKSSIIQRVNFAGRAHLLEADAIANLLSSASPRLATISAGREVLQRTREYLDNREDFAIETTLSGNWTRTVIRDALERQFFVRLIYICLDSPERCIQRVKERVAQGGHHVPASDVRRRYTRSLRNLKEALAVLNHVIIYDNSGVEPQLVLEVCSGIVWSKASGLPGWAGQLLKRARD